MPREPATGEQDFRVSIGERSFDPKVVASHARRRATAARRRAGSGDATGRALAAAGGQAPVIVQFAQPLSALDMARLRAEYDLRLDQYVPNLAYLERLAPETGRRLRNDFLVRASIALDPALKLSPTTAADGAQPIAGAPLVSERDEAGRVAPWSPFVFFF